MHLAKDHRYPVRVISFTLRLYHRFNLSYRDIAEQLRYRGITVSHEAIRHWCFKFSRHFIDVIKKRDCKPTDKWHLDEMTIKINGAVFILWRAVDDTGHELDVLLQKRRNKKAAIRFLACLLSTHPAPRVVVSDKLRSYTKPIKSMMPGTEHRKHKRLNNCAENSHQPTRRKKKCLICYEY